MERVTTNDLRVYTFLFPRLKTGLRNRTTSQPHYAPYLTSTETDSASAAENPGCICQRESRIDVVYLIIGVRRNLCRSSYSNL